MTSPRHKNTVLKVIATEIASVREIDEKGKPLMDCRVVGKHPGGVIIEGGVSVPYHAHYIARLKEGSLLAADKETAKLAGVSLFSKPSEPLSPSTKKYQKETE